MTTPSIADSPSPFMLPKGTSAHVGKLPPRIDKRTLVTDMYAADGVQIPAQWSWEGDIVDWGMYLNDRIGDCTIAAAAHEIMWWTDAAGKPIVPAESDILAAYVALTGYDPATGANDTGCVELDVLNYWRNTGIAGHQIGAYAKVPGYHPRLIKQAAYLFEGLYLGVQLPKSAEGAAEWRVPYYGPYGSGEPGSWGGHAVPVVEYDKHGLTVITWGQPLRMTWPFFRVYVDEAYGIVSQDMLAAGGTSPLGLNIDQLNTDLTTALAA